MKRSDMLGRLAALLCQSSEPSKDMYLKYYNDADQILTFLENNGMQPPTIIILQNSYNRAEGCMGFEVNEWEPEITEEVK